MLDKYTELYDELVNKIVELHNAHISLTHKPTRKSFLRMRKAIADLKDHTNPLRMEVLREQREYVKDQKEQWLAHKEKLRLKREAKEARKKLKENNK